MGVQKKEGSVRSGTVPEGFMEKETFSQARRIISIWAELREKTHFTKTAVGVEALRKQQP